MENVALIIIYNHQYNRNIEILEKLYNKRFNNIYHLVPFYSGDKPNVISVYESSHYFQGYIAQGFKSFFKEKYKHYFFIADDLILNPVINQENYTEYFKLDAASCFLPNWITLHERKEWWKRVGEAFRYKIKAPGVEPEGQLPDYKTALKLFDDHNLKIMPLSFNQIWPHPLSIKDFARIIVKDKSYIFRYIKDKLIRNNYNLSYPLVGSYSDISIVSADSIKKFSHYCGVFAVTKLFVEIALPTALALSSKKIVVEENLELKGFAIWTKEDLQILDKFEFRFNSLLQEFPNYLYIHPIKLSKWK
jgi:hypothetical protein